MSEKNLTLLLLLGDRSEHFLESLGKVVEHFSSFIIHDVASQSYIDEVLGVLAPIPGAHARRNWKGELESRQDLVNLLLPGQMGLLSDSLTDIYQTSSATKQSFTADIYTVASLENGRLLRKPKIFRGGKGFQVSQDDFTQLSVDEVGLYPNWQGFRVERGYISS